MSSNLVIDEVSLAAHKRQADIINKIYAAIPEWAMVGDVVIALSDVMTYFVSDFSTDIYAGLKSYGEKIHRSEEE